MQQPRSSCACACLVRSERRPGSGQEGVCLCLFWLGGWGRGPLGCWRLCASSPEVVRAQASSAPTPEPIGQSRRLRSSSGFGPFEPEEEMNHKDTKTQTRERHRRQCFATAPGNVLPSLPFSSLLPSLCLCVFVVPCPVGPMLGGACRCCLARPWAGFVQGWQRGATNPSSAQCSGASGTKMISLASMSSATDADNSFRGLSVGGV
jgi:hypothetical protein